MTSTPTKPVDNVVIATKGLQDRNTNIIAGTTVENKGKLILTNYYSNILTMNIQNSGAQSRVVTVEPKLRGRHNFQMI